MYFQHGGVENWDLLTVNLRGFGFIMREREVFYPSSKYEYFQYSRQPTLVDSMVLEHVSFGL